jgi:hypothetical protein
MTQKIPELPEPGTPQWEKWVKYDLGLKKQREEVNARYEREKRGDGSSSWERIDLTDAIYGKDNELKPQWMHREDGKKLLYPGCTHSFHGSSGSGKTWVALLTTAQVLKETEQHVLYLDYESFATQIVRRLISLSVAPEVIKERLHYYRPRHRPDVADIDRNAFADMLNREYAVAVVDGANICMGLAGLKPNNAEDVAEWHAMILNPIAERTGAATLANDHVPKKADLSGFAIGSQHKIGGLTGAAFTVEKIESFGRGRYGKATIRVGDKDREGYIHEIAVNDDQPDGQLVAELHIDATNVSTTLTVTTGFFVPQNATITNIANKRNRAKNGSGSGSGATGRPTKEMEAVSAYWEENKNDQLVCTQNKTINAIRDRQQNQQKAQMSRDRLRAAINLLVDHETKGGPYATTIDGPRKALIYLGSKQYFEANDPVVIAANRQAQAASNGTNVISMAQSAQNSGSQGSK